MTAQNANSTVVEAPVDSTEIELSTEALAKGWNMKHPKCKECGTDTHKNYSGGSCSTCYTNRRNERLGIGAFDPEANAKRIAKKEAKIAKLEQELKDLKLEVKDLKKKVA